MKSNELDRRKFLKTVAALGTTVALGPFAMTTAESKLSSRPNILLCLADDWGWPHAGAYGDKVVKTPVFDRLARDGVLFEYAFVSSPSCTPSRNSILTGQQFYRLEDGANLHSTLDVGKPNFMSLLRDQGYQIGHCNKAWGPGDFSKGGYTGNPCGPESSFPEFMQNRDRDKPFCFWFGTSDPHRSYEKGSGKKSGINLDEIQVPEFYPNKEEIRSDIADYYFEVQRWDNDVGTALKLLEESGELDNTIIVMSGDNGMPFPRCKANLYDRGVRVPLAIRWGNRVKPDRIVTDFTSLSDLAPTFLEAAGLRIPEQMTGRSLLPVLQAESDGRVNPKRNFMVFGRERHSPAQKMPSLVGYPSRALRTDGWLLILNLEPERWPVGVPTGATHPMDVHTDCDNSPTKSLIINCMDDPELAEYYQLCFAKRPPVELYDCKTDPNQIHNLAANPELAPTVQALRKQLIDYLTATADPRFTELPVKFDTYPYNADYLKKNLEKHGYKLEDVLPVDPKQNL